MEVRRLQQASINTSGSDSAKVNSIIKERVAEDLKVKENEGIIIITIIISLLLLSSSSSRFFIGTFEGGP